MASAVVAQQWWTPNCDSVAATREAVAGKTILVTGGGVGIGLDTTKGLLERGAHVIIASRRPLDAVVASLQPLCQQGGGSVTCMTLDLGDMASVVAFVQALKAKGGIKLDIVIENAGLWPRTHGLSAQGHESAFAVNCLGNLLLRKLLDKHGLLVPTARIIVVTGDIYIMANECSSDFTYNGEGQMAYCRSKLGVNWCFDEFHKQHPSYTMLLVHPGVLPTELASDNDAGCGEWVKHRLLVSNAAGAQVSLICAVAPLADLVNGGYYHNTCGLMQLRDDDPSSDKAKASALYAHCEQLCAPFMK